MSVGALTGGIRGGLAQRISKRRWVQVMVEAGYDAVVWIGGLFVAARAVVQGALILSVPQAQGHPGAVLHMITDRRAGVRNQPPSRRGVRNQLRSFSGSQPRHTQPNRCPPTSSQASMALVSIEKQMT